MVRIYRRSPKNAVRHWRATALHPAIGDASALLRPELIAGPYVLLADLAPNAVRDSRPLSN